MSRAELVLRRNSKSCFSRIDGGGHCDRMLEPIKDLGHLGFFVSPFSRRGKGSPEG